jgi:hypothetical protein
MTVQYIELMFILLFTFITSFLWHELMHIKSQGITATGKIYVNKTGMTANCYGTWNNDLFYYGGGTLTSIIMFTMVFLTKDIWQWTFLTMGWLQLLYGIYEGKNHKVPYRYILYLIVIAISVIIWRFNIFNRTCIRIFC